MVFNLSYLKGSNKKRTKLQRVIKRISRYPLLNRLKICDNFLRAFYVKAEEKVK